MVWQPNNVPENTVIFHGEFIPANRIKSRNQIKHRSKERKHTQIFQVLFFQG
jgi:hypothetical protein